MDSEIKFIIIMPTYYRKNNSTISYLERSLNSIINQTYNNWDLLIVGDKYEKEDELISLISYFQNLTSNRIIYLKNDNVEREHVKDKMRLWNCAGATSVNLGLEYARQKNYKFYAHLDDDDYWEKNHLEVLAEAYFKFKNCVFVNTKSKYRNSFLPIDNIEVKENNLLPRLATMIHSSFSFRIDIINYNYATDLFNGISKPSDGIMLDKIREFILKNSQYCSIYMPIYTCNHIEEGLARKL
jgi:glycosyltransferase involved in cell wall biosynthesis